MDIRQRIPRTRTYLRIIYTHSRIRVLKFHSGTTVSRRTVTHSNRFVEPQIAKQADTKTRNSQPTFYIRLDPYTRAGSYVIHKTTVCSAVQSLPFPVRARDPKDHKQILIYLLRCTRSYLADPSVPQQQQQHPHHRSVGCMFHHVFAPSFGRCLT